MLVRNGEIRGADINFTHPSDVLGPFKSAFFCSIQHAYPKVLMNHCTVNNPLGALNVLAQEDAMTNSQNKALHLIDPRDPDEAGLKWMRERGVVPGPIDPAEWVIVSGMTFDFCYLPVFCFATNTEIVYTEPALSKHLFTREEWQKLEALYQNLKEPQRAPAMSRQQRRFLERKGVSVGTFR